MKERQAKLRSLSANQQYALNQAALQTTRQLSPETTTHRLLAGDRSNYLPTLMTLADRKWLQGRLEELTKESPSVVTVVLDLSDRLGESVTMAILAATESMTADE